VQTCVRCGKSYQSSTGDIEGLCDICERVLEAEVKELSAGNAGYVPRFCLSEIV
jgi:NMD protein affecting ribosome stability and mRNA decay